MLQRLLDGEPPVLLVGVRDRGLRLLVHDLREHPVAPQRILPGEDALRVVGKPRSVVTNEIAHQPHEHEVGGPGRGVADRHSPPIVAGIEVRERVEPPAGVEELAGTRGIGALHRARQEALRRHRTVVAQRLERPAGERIPRGEAVIVQRVVAQPRDLMVELLHDFEVVDQGPNLRGASQ